VIWLVGLLILVIVLFSFSAMVRLNEKASGDEYISDGIPCATVDQGSRDLPVYTYEDYARDMGCNPDGVFTEDGKPYFIRSTT
jgi:hypothetical protein